MSPPVVHRPDPRFRKVALPERPALRITSATLGESADTVAAFAAEDARRRAELDEAIRGELLRQHTGTPKLTSEQVESIRARAGVVSKSALARECGVNTTTIGRVLRGDSWRGEDPGREG